MSSAKLLPLIVALWLWAMASSLAAEDNADGDAIAAIRRRGGEVILGAEAYDGQVVAVDLLIAEFGDTDLDLLKGFASLEELNLRGTKVTDAGIKRLRVLKQLRSLNLTATNLTDAGIAELMAFPHLESLVLRYTHITDNGVSQLRGRQHSGH